MLTPIKKGRRFRYPPQWCKFAIKDDVRVSENPPVPTEKLPIFTTDFNMAEPYAVWFGHSLLLICMGGKRILIDPTFSKRASPVSFAGPKRFTAPSVETGELPQIDAVLITHDHYDHLDCPTIKELNGKVKRYFVPVGVDKILKRWDIPDKKIIPLSWWDSENMGDFEITCTSSRHFSGRRLFSQNTTLWCSWVVRFRDFQIFARGDGSFGCHFEAIHKRFGDFNFAFMECGQYNKRWHSSHLYPEESAIAAKAIGAEAAVPIHWGAFVLSDHGWNDSPKHFRHKAEEIGLNVVIPNICKSFSLAYRV